jgi:hypothetical protein
MEPNMKKVLTLLILSTLADVPEGGSEGSFYAALMDKCDLDTFQSIIGLITANGLATRSNHWLAPTARGIELGKKITEQLSNVAPS